MFDRQIETLGKSGDVLICYSTSRTSKNIVKAASVAKSMDIKFKLKIVNDKLIWNDEGDKSKGYNVKDGRNLYKTGFIHEISARTGVSKPKKKA